MKKTLTVLLLVLAITTSLIAGTMAYYTVTLDNLVQGEVVAKEFIFVEKEGQQTLSFSDKMAPGETVEWPFTVQNHKDGLVTETDMYYRLTFVVGATEGKQAIAPLTVTVNGEVVTLNDDGIGTLTTDGEFKLKPTDNQQSEDYKIVLTWPHGDKDSEYAGNNFGTTVTVNAVAQQVPFDEVEPETPEEPGETVDAQIAYQEAKEAVGQAEASTTQVDVDTAWGLVNALVSGDISRLEWRLNTITIGLTPAKEAVEQAEETKKQVDVDTARDLINALIVSDKHEEYVEGLLARLNSVQADVAPTVTSAKFTGVTGGKVNEITITFSEAVLVSLNAFEVYIGDPTVATNKATGAVTITAIVTPGSNKAVLAIATPFLTTADIAKGITVKLASGAVVTDTNLNKLDFTSIAATN